MPTLKRFCASVAILSMLCLPLPAAAQFDEAGFLPFSFGGRVIAINYCLHGAVNITIQPAGLFAIEYVWSLPPATISVFPAPLISIGQQVLGVALPALVPCVGFGTKPPVWYGYQVIYGGASLGF